MTCIPKLLANTTASFWKPDWQSLLSNGTVNNHDTPQNNNTGIIYGGIAYHLSYDPSDLWTLQATITLSKLGTCCCPPALSIALGHSIPQRAPAQEGRIRTAIADLADSGLLSPSSLLRIWRYSQCLFNASFYNVALVTLDLIPIRTTQFLSYTTPFRIQNERTGGALYAYLF